MIKLTEKNNPLKKLTIDSNRHFPEKTSVLDRVKQLIKSQACMETPNFSQFKSIGEYESFQKARILYAFLLITSLATIPMGISNLNQGEISAAVSLFAFSFLCILGLVLNYRNDQRTAAGLFAISGYFVIFYNLAVGGGLRDTAIVALPLITIFAGLLFGKRATLIFTATTILGVLIFQTFEQKGSITPDFSVGNASLLILNLTLIVVGLVEYILMSFWERNLQWVQHSEERIRDSYEKTLEGIAWALEFRDCETEGHSRRVVNLSLKFVKKLNISDPEELNQLRQGALLHDIGKMAIPDNVLLKPGPLTDAEWDIIKQHPELAKHFLERLPLLSAALDIPYCHHENWDGTGYPLGLEKEQIPLQARIFSIIDNWDALNSDRPYRKAWERDKIISYLKENASKKFDPKLVTLFLELIEEENL